MAIIYLKLRSVYLLKRLYGIRQSFKTEIYFWYYTRLKDHLEYPMGVE